MKKGNDQRVNSSQQQRLHVLSKLLIHLYQMEHLTPEKGLAITENHRNSCTNERGKNCLHIKNRFLQWVKKKQGGFWKVWRINFIGTNYIRTMETSLEWSIPVGDLISWNARRVSSIFNVNGNNSGREKEYQVLSGNKTKQVGTMKHQFQLKQLQLI